MLHLRQDDVSGATTFALTAGYIIAYITCYRKTGTPLIIAGTTVAGNNILYGMNLNGTSPIWQTAHIAQETDYGNADTLYVDVSAGTADIDILLIYNRQS